MAKEVAEDTGRVKVLITGASGFVGSRLAELAATELAPENVTCLIGPYENDLQRQRTERLRTRDVCVIQCDLRRSPVLPAELSDFDVLFHMAAYVTTEVNSPDVAINDEGTERLIRELGERLAGKLVLFASTLAAAEAPPSARGGLESPIRPETPPAPRTPYGLSKLRAETTLRECGQLLGFRHVILRLCTVYGSDYRSGGMFDVLPAMLRKRSPFVKLAWSGRLSLVQVDDLVSLFWRCAADSRAWGRTFLVSSGEDPAVSAIIERIAELIEVPYRRLPSSPLLFGLARAVLGAHWIWDRLPYPLFIAAWRAELLLDGLFCDGSELTKLFAFQYRRWQDSFADLYRKGVPDRN